MRSSRYLLIPLFLISSFVAFAQSEIGGASLRGTLSDPSGAVIPNAKISATNQANGIERTVNTNEAGFYNFVRLPVGSYEIRAEASGFQPLRRTGVLLTIGSTGTVDLQMQVGATQEAVSISADVPVVETTSSQTSTTVNARAVADLPVNGRNFLDFALLTPGVARDPRGGDLSFGGQRGTANSLLVDGGDSNNLFFGQSTGRAGVRNPYAFSQDSVQEFQVNTNTYAAEIGRAGGGVINVITKSGTNEVHGTGFWFHRNREFNANTFINNSRNIPRQPYQFHQFGGNIGAPIKKDKLFIFFDYDAQRNKFPNPVFLAINPPSDPLSQQALRELQPKLTPYTRQFDNNVFLVKGDWNINSNERLTVRYNANRFTGKNLENSGNNSAAEHTGDSKVKTDNITGTYSWVLNPALVWDSRVIYLSDRQPGEANSPDPEAVILQNNVTVMQIGRNNFSPRYTNTKRLQTIQSLSYIRKRHSYKFGFDINTERIDNFFPGLFSGSYTFQSYADFAARRAFSYSQAFAGDATDGPLTRPNINEYAFFAQDSWRTTNRLTLNYGVRYDLMDSFDPKVKNTNAQLLASGFDTSRMNLDTNNWAGRFGFAYRLTKGEKMVLRGGLGTYYARTPAIMTGTAHSQNGIQVRSFQLFQNLPTYPNRLAAPPPAGAPPNLYVFAPDYVQPQTHQWSLNLETALGKDYSLTVGYLGVRGIHLSRTRDVNLFPAEATQGRFADGTAVTFFRHPGTAGPARPNSAFGRISVFDSGADSIYHGGFVQLSKRYASNFQVLTSYTWSKVIDSNPNQTSVVVGTDDRLTAQDTLRPNTERGLGDADVRHRFILSGVWDIVYARSLANPVAKALLGDWQLALISAVQSGGRFSATVTGDPNNNGQTATDRPPFIGRNTIQGPGLATVDARVSRDIPIYKERAKLRLILEAFNLTNRANFNNFNRGQFTFNAGTRVFTPTTNYLIRTGSADPRILQVAAKITF